MTVKQKSLQHRFFYQLIANTSRCIPESVIEASGTESAEKNNLIGR